MLEEIAPKPPVIYTANRGKYLEFMNRTGSIIRNASSWRNVLFENVDVKNGS